MNATVSTSKFHYAWVIAFVGLLSTMACLGLARFAFGMMLPLMARALDLNYTQQGILGTGYFVGYLGMVATLPWLVPKLGPRLLTTLSLSLVAISVCAFALTREFHIVATLYVLAGIGSGGAFVPTMSLASQWFHPSHRGLAAGISLAGAGTGIMLSGLTVPHLEPMYGFDDWQIGWMFFGAIAFVLAIICAVFFRDTPAQMGLQPYGTPSSRPSGQPDNAADPSLRAHTPILLHLGGIYAIYGATYLIYATFVVTSMIDDFGLDHAGAGQLWVWVGFFSIFSGALFGRLSDQLGRRGGLMAAFATMASAFILVALPLGEIALYVSVFLFGISAWSIVTIMSAAAGDYLGPRNAAAGLAVLTFLFTIGQTIGPATAGALAEWSGGFGLGFGLCAALAGMAVIWSGFLKPPTS